VNEPAPHIETHSSDDSFDFRPTRTDIKRSIKRVPVVSHFIFTKALGRVWLLGLLATIYSTAAVLELAPIRFGISFSFEALLTIGVSLMLSIRVSKAYDRWWEGRKQWGKLVNISRNLAIKLRSLTPLSEQERVEVHRLIQGFARSLKNHLRGKSTLEEIRGFPAHAANPLHVPAYLAGLIYDSIESLKKENRLSDINALIIDSEARELLEVAGACERIQGTPPPPSFVAFVRFSMTLMILDLPWELAPQLGWYTLPITALATFLTCGGESIANHLDTPFNIHTDGLDLEAYCNGIDRVTAEILHVRTRAD